MSRKQFTWCLLLLSALGLLMLPLDSTALGQAAHWQGGAQFATGAPYYVAQQDPAAPPAAAAAPAPPAAAPQAQPQVQPQPEPAPSDYPDTPLPTQDPLVRLASVPNMFGDSFGAGGQVLPFETTFESLFDPHHSSMPIESFSDVSSGAARRVKIAENNKALPVDRVYFSYNHFQNAIEGASYSGAGRAISLDQYTLGWEKTFRDGRWSCEIRMPFSGGYHINGDEVDSASGHIGNLAILLKRIVLTTETGVVAAGLGISTPTGSDVTGYVNGTRFEIGNEALNFSPYIGFLSERYDPFFMQGFLQVDVPIQGNPVRLGNTYLGRYNDQPLMFIDFEMGCWLFRDRPGLIRAMAALLEFHYTTTLEDTDVVSGSDGASSLTVVNAYNRLDVVNMTVGLHTQVGEQTHFGVGAVLPLDDAGDRFFDGEFQIFLNRLY